MTEEANISIDTIVRWADLYDGKILYFFERDGQKWATVNFRSHRWTRKVPVKDLRR